MLPSLEVPETAEITLEEETTVIEMFASPHPVPFGAPNVVRPFSPPVAGPRGLQLITTYDLDEQPVTVTVSTTSPILRNYDGGPEEPTEVRVECVATAPHLRYLPALRVPSGPTQ